MDECSEHQPTIYEAIISLANPQNNDAIGPLNDFLTSKMTLSPLDFIKDIIIMILDENIPQQYSRYLLVHFSNAVSNRLRPYGFFQKKWKEIITEVLHNTSSPEQQVDLMQVVNCIHSRLTNFLNDPDPSIRSNSSLCISRLIFIEYSLGLWNDFFPSLFNVLRNTRNNIYLLDGSFLILISLLENNFIYNGMQDFELIISNIYDLLKIYISNELTDIRLRILSFKVNLKSLNMLDFFFKQPEELHGYIQYLMLNFATIYDQTIHQLAYEILKSMFVRHTNEMNELMPNIFPFILQDFTSNNEYNKVLAIEFWAEIAINENQNKIQVLIHNYAPQLVPILLNSLISDVDISRKKTIEINNDNDNDDMIEFDENDAFNVIDNSAFCLRCFVDADPDAVAPIIVKFINENFNSPKISLKIASLNATYALIKFREFEGTLSNMMPFLIYMVEQDDNIDLQSCALFIISKTISTYKKFISSPDCFYKLMAIVDKRIKSVIQISKLEEASNFNSHVEKERMLRISLNKKNLILERTFFLLSKIINCFRDDEMKEFLDQHFELLLQIFPNFIDQYPSYRNEPPMIILVFETISYLIYGLPLNSKDKLIQILTFAYNNIQNEIKSPQNNSSIFIAMNCSLINNISTYIKQEIEPFVGDIMELFNVLFSREDEEIFFEALRVIESFIWIFKSRFVFYFPRLSDILIKILATYTERSSQRLTLQAIRITGVFFRLKNPEIVQKAEEYYQLILKISSSIFDRNPNSPQVNQKEGLQRNCYIFRPPFSKDILPYIIDALSYITAASTKDLDEKFCDQLSMLKKAQEIQIDLASDSDKELSITLYENILFCYLILIQIITEKNLIIKNIKQIIEAFSIWDAYSLITKRSSDIFLSIINCIVKCLKYDFCQYLDKERCSEKTFEKFSVILKILGYIENFPDEDSVQKAQIVSKKISKCLWLKEAINNQTI